MASPASRRADLGYASLVALLVTATLGGGGVLYQIVAHGGHAHVAATGAARYLPEAIDALGVVMMFLLATQLMSGYRLFQLGPGQFRRVHTTLPWVVVGILALHGVAGVVHTFQGVPEALPVWLDVIGITIVALLALQLSSGYEQPKRVRLRRVHATVALPIALIVSVHAVIGLAHTLSG